MSRTSKPRRPLALLALALAACAPSPGDSAPEAAATTPQQFPAAQKTITAQELADQIRRNEAPLILDVRTPKEYERGHIPGSLNIPQQELAARLSEIPVAKTQEIVVHCHSGHRAKLAEKVLLDAGYSNVLDLDGHMDGWRKGDYPIETP